MTTVQKITIGLIIAYVLWEIFVQIKTPEANIRVDLILIYPVLLILIIISIIQYFKR